MIFPYLSSLLISLAILRSLLSECKRDVGLFASSVIKILEKALQVATKPVAGGGLDLEIAIRTVSVVCHSCVSVSLFVQDKLTAPLHHQFTSFVTYADGGVFAADDSTLTSYLSVLRRLASLAVQPDTSTSAVLDEKGARDHELRNRFGPFFSRCCLSIQISRATCPPQNTLDWSCSPFRCSTK
jgi:hypothetical protein